MSDSVRPQRRQPTRLLSPWNSPGKNTGVGCHFLLQCTKVKVKSCPTLRNPMDCSLPGSSIHGIFQARVLEWGAIAFSESSVPGGFNAVNPGPHLQKHYFKLFRKQVQLLYERLFPPRIHIMREGAKNEFLFLYNMQLRKLSWKENYGGRTSEGNFINIQVRVQQSRVSKPFCFN